MAETKEATESLNMPTPLRGELGVGEVVSVVVGAIVSWSVFITPASVPRTISMGAKSLVLDVVSLDWGVLIGVAGGGVGGVGSCLWGTILPFCLLTSSN